MSNVTTIYETLVTTMGTLFPNKTRLPNAYNVELNDDNFMFDGWGIRVGSSIPKIIEFNQYSSVREFVIIFTQRVDKQYHGTSEEDTIVKSMLEDVNTVQKDFYNVDELGIGSSVTQIDLGPTSAIGNIYGERSTFKDIEVTFLFQITENL